MHNRYVVDSLRKRGAIFIEQISGGAIAIPIFSAHGVSQRYATKLKSTLRCRCHLSRTKSMEVARASRCGEESILIGHTSATRKSKAPWDSTTTRKGMYLVESPEDVLKLEVKMTPGCRL